MITTTASSLSRRPFRLTNRLLLSSVATRTSAYYPRWAGSSAPQQRLRCSQSEPTTSTSPMALQFWNAPLIWKRAGINTLRCLVGCTIGDFSAMWYLQAFYSDLGMEAIMAISMASGITCSMLLETALLRFGRDRLPWAAAAKTAAGMSAISMITMEMAENAVDYYMTGGVVQLDSPAFWSAALLSVAAGFLAPLPYNYLRLRKYGKACH